MINWVSVNMKITVKQALAYITGDELIDKDKIALAEFKIESYKNIVDLIKIDADFLKDRYHNATNWWDYLK